MTSEEIVREIDDASLTLLRLTSEVVRLREELAKLRSAAEWFVARVERGEVRSRKSYARFCEALGRSEPPK